MERMTVTVEVTDGWMVKALAKQIHTMKWNGRAPGVIVQSRRQGIAEQLNKTAKAPNKAFKDAYYGQERKVL